MTKMSSLYIILAIVLLLVMIAIDPGAKVIIGSSMAIVTALNAVVFAIREKNQ